MKFDISIENDLSNLTAKSIFENEYVIEEHMSLESAADEICGILSEEQIIAQEDFMETFRKVKAFVIMVFRKIVNVIKMWWKKRAIKRLCKSLRRKLVPLSSIGQAMWLTSVIVRNKQMNKIYKGESIDFGDESEEMYTIATELDETGNDDTGTGDENTGTGDENTGTGDENTGTGDTSKEKINGVFQDALILILVVCSSSDFAMKINTLKRMIKDLAVSEIDKTVSGFRRIMKDQCGDAVTFLRRGGIFGKDNFLGGVGITSLCTAASKQLGLNTQTDVIIQGLYDIANTASLTSEHFKIIMDNTDKNENFQNVYNSIKNAIDDLKNMKKDKSLVDLKNVFAEFNKLSAKQQQKLTDFWDSHVGFKFLTQGEVNTIERSLTDLVDFYNIFSLKLLYFMDRLEPDEKDSLRPFAKLSQEILHQIFGIIHHCNYVINDINMTKYDLDYSSVEEILDENDEISTESFDYDSDFLTLDDLN